ncbi:MAG: DUF1796 family putative cysteine peptidase [Anaerovoracaceae bacterium]
MIKYKKIISLGYFCSPALEIKREGLRIASFPFDWLIIPDFQTLLFLIESKFEDFMTPKYFYQFKSNPSYYKNIKYNIDFYHDFNPFIPFAKQIDEVSQKYTRRINRFYEEIQEPTLFIRYVSSYGEIEYIEKNYDYVMNVLKTFNSSNDIIFVANSEDLKDNLVKSSILKVWTVNKDKNDTVSREFLKVNEDLEKYILEHVSFENNNKYKSIETKKSFINRVYKKVRLKLNLHYHHKFKV